MSTQRGKAVSAIRAAIVTPVAKRLSRIEALLIEMRCEQDVQLKKIRALEAKLTTFAEEIRPTVSRTRKKRREYHSMRPTSSSTHSS